MRLEAPCDGSLKAMMGRWAKDEASRRLVAAEPLLTRSATLVGEARYCEGLEVFLHALSVLDGDPATGDGLQAIQGSSLPKVDELCERLLPVSGHIVEAAVRSLGADHPEVAGIRRIIERTYSEVCDRSGMTSTLELHCVLLAIRMSAPQQLSHIAA